MVGHTHEDIDPMFKKFLEKLRTSMTFTFPHLMQHFQSCQTTRPTPFMLTHVEHMYLISRVTLMDTCVILKMHLLGTQFRFYMQGDIPLMQYKMHPKSIDWLPMEGGIELWKRDEAGIPHLAKGDLIVVPMFVYIKDHEEVVS